MKKTYSMHFLSLRKCCTRIVALYVLFFVAGLLGSFSASAQNAPAKSSATHLQAANKPVVAQKSNDPSWMKAAPSANSAAKSEEGETKPSLEKKWNISPFDQKAFIENKGQFGEKEGDGNNNVLFQACLGGIKAYFTPQGIVYRYDTYKVHVEGKHKGKGEDADKDEDDMDKTGFVNKPRIHYLDATWVGSNPNVTVSAENIKPGQYGYTIGRNTAVYANIYGKIVYHNIYPGIDIEYIVVKDQLALEYTIIVHPGADLSKLKIVYKGTKTLSVDANANVNLSTDSLGDFKETAPIAFYEGTNDKVNVSTTINGNEESFVFPQSYDNTKTLVIDPTFGSTSPGFTHGYNNAYDVDYDNAGNVYVYGGYNPFQLSKFNSAGTLQWTYTCPGTFDAVYYGGMAVDKNSQAAYMVEGFYDAGNSGAEGIKVRNNTLLGTFPGAGTMQEMWRVLYNRCSGQLVIGGGGTNVPSYQAAMLDTNMITMNPVNPLNTTEGYWDVDRMALDPSGSPAYMSIAASSDYVYNGGWAPSQINILMSMPVPSLSPANYVQQPMKIAAGRNAALMEVNSSDFVGPGYTCDAFGNCSSQNNGFNGMAASTSWLYSYDDYTLTRHNKGTGAYSTSVGVSGYNTNFYGNGESDVYWGGLAVDQCENIYVGNQSSMLTYNSSLVKTTTTGLPNTVYDIVLGPNEAIIYACGKGFVEAFANVITTSSAVATPTSTTCGLSNGSATASLTVCGNPAAGVTYKWLPGGQTGQTATGLAAGTYTVYMSFGCGETFTATATIAASTAPSLSVAASPSSTICSGGSTTLTASGGTSYTWSPGTGLSSTNGNPVTANPTTTQTYTVTDAVCTSYTTSVVVTVNATPAATSAGSNSPICAGSTLNLTSTNTGGTSYSWTGPNGFTSSSQNPSIVGATAAASGTYSVTTTSAAGCTSPVATVVVTVNALPAAPVATSNSPICVGSTLNLFSTNTGGTSWNWTGPNAFASGAQNPSIAGATVAASGVYTVTTTTAAGCKSANGTVTVTVNSPPAAPTAGSNSPICSGQTLNLTSTNTGGTTWNWTGPNGFTSGVQNPSIAGATTAASGTYTVTTSSAAGCPSAQATVVVTVNATPAAPVATSNSPICAGNTLNLFSTNTGGTSYNWTGPNGFTSGVQNPSIAGATTAASGTYTVYTTSAAGCKSANGTVTVTVNTTPTAPVASSNSPVCTGQTLNLSSTNTGGTTWSWTGPNAFASGVQNPSIAGVTAAAAGTYTVTTSIGGCTSPQATVVVVVNTTPAAPVATSNSPICSGSTLNLFSTNTGGTSWSWTGPNAFASGVQNPSIAGATVAASGVYTVTTTSALGCKSANGTVTVVVNPTPPAPTLGSNSPICSGANLNLTSSSAGATSYSWTGPNAFVSGVQNPTITAATTAAAGTYSVTAKTAAGCTSPQSTITVVVNPTPTISIAPNPITICPGATVSITASGDGVGGIYAWTPNTALTATTGATVTASPTVTITYTVNGGTAAGCPAAPSTVVVTVANSLVVSVTPASPSVCSGDSVQLNASGAASFTWKPSTALSCTACANPWSKPGSAITYTVIGISGACKDSANVTVNINPTPTVSITISGITAAICPGDSMTMTASGLAAGGTYSWSPATGLSCSTCAVTIAKPGSTITYTVTGTNPSGCKATATQVITVYPKPVITVTPNQATICSGDTVSLTASGVSTYSWSPNVGLNTTAGPTVIASPGTSTTYTVTGKGLGGCKTKDSAAVTVNPTPTVTIAPPVPAVCAGSSVSLTASGANSYTWSPTTGLSPTTGPTVVATPTATTTYTVVGTSALGCRDTNRLVVTVNMQPVVTVTPPTPAVCFGDSVNLKSGGAGPGGTYTWSPATSLNNTNTDSVWSNPSGPITYTVTGTTTAGCTSNATVTIGVGTLTVTANAAKSTICSGTSTTITGGGASNFTWKPNIGLSATTGSVVTANPLATQTYTVIGTSGSGCSDSATVIVTVNTTPTVVISAGSPTICFGGTGTSITATGATTYAWSPATGITPNTTSSVVNANPSTTQTYTVTGTSSGCSSTSTVTVTVDKVVVTATAAPPAVCSGSSSTLTALGASTYIWSPSASLSASTGSPVTAMPAGTTPYKVVGTDALGCKDSANVTLTINTIPTLSITATDTNMCQGTSSTMTASGATNYTWTPNTNLSVTTGAVVIATPTTTVTYTVTGTTAGCNGTATQVITVNTTPVVTITVAGGNTVCPNQPFTMSGNGAANYVWTPSATLSSSTGSPVTGTITTGPVTYKVVGSNGVCADSATATINIYPPLLATTTTDSICSGKNGIVQVNASGGDPAYTYSWGSPLTTATGPGPFVVNPASTTTYSCTVTDVCGSTATANDIVFVNVSAVAAFTPTPDTIMGGQYVSFVDSSQNATSWLWTFGDGGTSDSIFPYYQYVQMGNYVVTLIVTNSTGCADTVSHIVYVTEGLFVPNVFTPNGDGINDVFHVTAGSLKTYFIEIFNRWGEKVFEANSPNIDWTGKSMSGVQESDGSYYYIIKATDYKNQLFNRDGYVQLIRN